MKIKLDYPQVITLDSILDQKKIARSLQDAMFDQRESNHPIVHFEDEQQLLDAVRRGDLNQIITLINTSSNLDIYMGQMSNDQLLQARYSFVSAITLITRNAILGGLPEIDAYNLSDIYIQTMDRSTNLDTIFSLFLSALIDFTKRVETVSTRDYKYSKPIFQCLEYINSHLHNRITLSDLAKVSQLSTAYISSLFRKETGQTFTEYYINTRLEAAKQMLLYTNNSITEIASLLSFSSHSNFSYHFNKKFKITPKAFRNSAK